jgi:protein O-mannosyl-transferase
MDSPDIRAAARPLLADPAGIPLWTDDFASLFQILHQTPRPEMDPQFTEAQTMIAAGLCQQGDFAGAVNCYRLALKTHSHLADLLNNLAWMLATCPDASVRNGPEAVQLAEKACRLTYYRTTPAVGTLAAAYAEAGRFDDAIAMAQKACWLASEPDQQELLKRNQELLALYLKHQPYHEAAGKNTPAAP